jgi:hypothetical protein
MARVAPLLGLHPEGGQLVVTRFECGSLPALLAVRITHARLKRHVRRGARGFLGVTAITDWRRRTMLSISLWQDLDSIYSMGNVPQHVAASRLPHRLGVSTTSGIFCLAGDWRRVMFRSDVTTRSPLQPLDSGPSVSSPSHSPASFPERTS